MRYSLPAMIIMGLMGVGLLLAQFLLHRRRYYMLYLGIASMLFAVTPIIPWDILRWSVIGLILAAIWMAIREARAETQERFARYQQEQHEREEAFSEYVMELARTTKQSPPSEEKK